MPCFPKFLAAAKQKPASAVWSLKCCWAWVGVVKLLSQRSFQVGNLEHLNFTRFSAAVTETWSTLSTEMDLHFLWFAFVVKKTFVTLALSRNVLVRNWSRCTADLLHWLMTDLQADALDTGFSLRLLHSACFVAMGSRYYKLRRFVKQRSRCSV